MVAAVLALAVVGSAMLIAGTGPWESAPVAAPAVPVLPAVAAETGAVVGPAAGQPAQPGSAPPFVEPAAVPPAAHAVQPRAAPLALTPRRVRGARPAVPRPADACAGTTGDERARCLYPELLRGDDALRAAYAEAVDAGVTGRALVPIRNRWARLRRNALVDPDGVADGYRTLERDIADLRAERADGGTSRTDSDN